MNDMQRKLAESRPALSPEEREALWTSIAYRLTPRKAGSPRRARAAIAGTLILGLFASGFVTVYASDAAVPGDILYPVDRAVEELRLAAAPTEEQKERIRVEQAYERLKEVETIISRSEGEDFDDESVRVSDEEGDLADTEAANATTTIEIIDLRAAKTNNEGARRGDDERDGRPDERKGQTKTEVGSPTRFAATATAPRVGRRDADQAIERMIEELRRAKESVRREDRRAEIEGVVRRVEEAKMERELKKQKLREERKHQQEKYEPERRTKTQENRQEQIESGRGGNVHTSVTVDLPEGIAQEADSPISPSPSDAPAPHENLEDDSSRISGKVSDDYRATTTEDSSNGRRRGDARHSPDSPGEMSGE